MGEETGKDCRSWEEKIYWTHFKCTHFSQFLRSGFYQRLAIPEKFARNLKRKLPDTVNLNGPSGAAWKVGLTTYDDTLYFNHGWQDFVKDHSLEENDFLIFKYNGESSFDVLMFEMQSMCEKAASYFVKKCEFKAPDNGFQTRKKPSKSSIDNINGCYGDDVAEGSQPEESMENDVPLGQPIVSPFTKKQIHREIKSFDAIREDVVEGSQPEESTDSDVDTIPLGHHIAPRVTNKMVRGKVLSGANGEDMAGGSTDNAIYAIPLEQPTTTPVSNKRICRKINSFGAIGENIAGGYQPKESTNNCTDAIPLVQPIASRVSSMRICKKVNSFGPVGEDIAGGSQPKESTDNDTDAIPLVQPIASRVSNKRIRRKVNSFGALGQDIARGSQPKDEIPLGQPIVSPGTKKNILRKKIKSFVAAGEDIIGGSQLGGSKDNDTDAIPLGQPVRNKKIQREIKSIRPIQSWRIVESKGPSTCAEEIVAEPDVQYLGRGAHYVHNASSRRPVTEEEKRNTMHLAVQAVTNNGFLVLMKPSHVYGRFFMSIPAAWFVDHFPFMGNQDVILCSEGKTWSTKFYYQKSRNSGGLSSGWKKFALDNNLHEFDVCVFEPESSVNNPVVLDVTIFHVVQEASSNSS